jgi:rSAM/selenodomain-associated transferase 2
LISVIIPTYNKEVHIKATIQRLWEYDQTILIKEIIIADGGSTDDTVTIARTEGVKIIVNPKKGRAAQMNYGAQHATSEILYFLLADTLPPKCFTYDITTAVNAGYSFGYYTLSFDYDHWFLQATCWFTLFDVDTICIGDQSLFVTKEKFLEVRDFCEKHIVLEDQQIIRQLKKISSFKVIKKPVVTSARKYVENGIYKTQGIFFLIYFMCRLGFSQQKLISTYRDLIRQDKL